MNSQKDIFRNRFIGQSQKMIDAFKMMDHIDKKLLIVLDDAGKYRSLLSAGDIQRAIINGVSLDSEINDILVRKVKIASINDDFDDIKKMMFDFRMELCPVIDENDNIVKVYFWEDLFGAQQQLPKAQFNSPVVIMAGGLGTRLKPLTNVLPKPLIPIGEKTIIENIFDRFAQHGCTNFYISVNYKAELIEYYLREQSLPYQLIFFKEDKPMGTAGSLSLLKNQIKETFFVSNCDILIEQDYSEILEYHRKNRNEITLVAALKSYHIPYGTIHSGKEGELLDLVEKPDLNFKINSGMYLLEPHLIAEIPENVFFHITHLIEKVKERRGKVGVFPVSEKSWRDIGEWSEYLSLINRDYIS